MKPITLLLFLAVLVGACGGSSHSSDSAPGTNAGAPPKERTLIIGAYTTPRELYGQKVLPAFAKYWLEKTGERVNFQQSYLGSGAQARAIAGGFEADVAALSLEPDIQQLVDAKLITRDWKTRTYGGMVSRSIVVIAVRPGNPKNIREWDDLKKPGVSVLTPNPRTSGGAMWNIIAMYGAALRHSASGGSGSPAAAEALLRGVVANVSIMDKGARESVITFEGGSGDAAITYENEVLVARQAGKAMDYVIPRSTVLIENPVAVVDVYADQHGTRDLADAFVDFLSTKESQAACADYGLRPVDETVARDVASRYPPVTDLFTVSDLGGWPTLIKEIFSDGAMWSRISERQLSTR